MARAISAADIRAIDPEASVPDFTVDGIDLAGGAVYERFLTFLDQIEFASAALENPRAAVILCTPTIAEKLEGSGKILVSVADPRWSYFSLQNRLASEREYPASRIDPSAVIHPAATIAPTGVTIGARVIVEAGVVIHPSVSIGDDSVIRAGAVLGSPGFEHKRTSHGILSVVHDGDTRIGARTEVGTNCVIAQGYARRHSIVGDDCRFDGMVYLAHGVHVGNRVFFAASATIAGMTTIEDDAWVGPGATVRDQVRIGAGARVNIGSVVFKDVPANTHVLGNPARELPRPA